MNVYRSITVSKNKLAELNEAMKSMDVTVINKATRVISLILILLIYFLFTYLYSDCI